MTTHLLALFEPVEKPFFSYSNTATKQNVLNFLKKAAHHASPKFANYSVEEVKELGSIQILGEEPKIDLGIVTSDDRLIIIGHGSAKSEKMSEYSPESLAKSLFCWGLKTVGTIYLCACETGLSQFPHKFAVALQERVQFASVRAPLGVVEINEEGRKAIYKDEGRKQPLKKGENKVIVDFWDVLLSTISN